MTGAFARTVYKMVRMIIWPAKPVVLTAIKALSFIELVNRIRLETCNVLVSIANYEWVTHSRL